MSTEDAMPQGADPSWWKKYKTKFREDALTFNLEECTGCRYISAGSMVLAGVYIGYVGFHRARRSGSRFGFIPSTVVAGIMGALGVMRLCGYNPFSSSGSLLGIDALEPIKARMTNALNERVRMNASPQDGVNSTNNVNQSITNTEKDSKAMKTNDGCLKS